MQHKAIKSNVDVLITKCLLRWDDGANCLHHDRVKLYWKSAMRD